MVTTSMATGLRHDWHWLMAGTGHPDVGIDASR
jgi:hypothetical protein